MVIVLSVGIFLLLVGVILLVKPSPMLSLLDRGYYTKLSPLWKIRRQQEMVERYEGERRLIRYLLPLVMLAIGAVWVGFAAANL